MRVLDRPNRRNSTPDPTRLGSHIDFPDRGTNADQHVVLVSMPRDCSAPDSVSWVTETEVTVPLVERQPLTVFVVRLSRRRLPHGDTCDLGDESGSAARACLEQGASQLISGCSDALVDGDLVIQRTQH
jgi:hypothetical protein